MIAILILNTLGTSSGDWLSDDTGLGFRNAFFVIAGIMVLILAAHYLTNINGMVLFWLAFILTRPLGAAGGDALTKPVDEGGLGWGTSGGSVALLVLLIGLVADQTIRLRRSPAGAASVPGVPAYRTTAAAQRPGRRTDQSPAAYSELSPRRCRTAEAAVRPSAPRNVLIDIRHRIMGFSPGW